MKRILIGFAITLVALVWMTGSWWYFNSIALGAAEPGTAAVADVGKTGSKDEAATSGQCAKHWKGRHGHHGLWKKLNLTDAQRSQVRSIIAEDRAKIKPLLQQLKAGRDQLDALRKSGPFDETKVRSIAKGQADTLTELVVARERMKSRIYAVLTPEQRAKAEQLRESWKARKGKEPNQKD